MFKNKTFTIVAVIGCLALTTSCQKLRNTKFDLEDTGVPKFVEKAEALAQESKPASEKSLIVNDIVPLRAEGDDKTVLPSRLDKPMKQGKKFDFPAELLKGSKDPNEMLKVAMDFDALPLNDVVPAFAEMLKFGFTIDPSLKGSVTINITDEMTAYELWAVFERLLWSSGAYATRSSHLIEILPFKKMPQEQRLFDDKNPPNVSVDLIRLESTTSAEVIAALKPFMTEGATISDIKRLNSLLIVETPRNMEKIRELIDKLDNQWHKNWPQKSIKCHSVDTETIVEELTSIMPVIGLPVTFDQSKTDGIEIKVTQVPRLQVMIVSGPTLESVNEIVRWIKVLDREDIGEQEQIFFYNVKHSTIEELRAALDTFFLTDGATTSGTQKKSTSSKASTSKSKSSSSSSSKRRTTSSSKNNTSESDSRSTVFDVPVTIFEDTFQNRMVIRTTERTYALIQALLERIDIPPLQVLIQTTIVDLNLTEGLEYGFRYALDGGNGKGQGSGGSGTGFGNKTGLPDLASGINLLFDDGTTAINFIASVAGKSNTAVVSAPQIVAISDEEAVIDITDEIPIPTVEYNSTSTNAEPQISWDQTKTATTSLTVTPHITANNEVTLEIKQEVEEFDAAALSAYTGENLEEGETVDYSTTAPPSVYKRSLETKLVVADGKTVLLGGMIKNKNTTNIAGLPLLMDIPWLGELFKYTNKTVSRNELLVLMTVNVIDNETRLEKILKRYKQAVDSIDKVLDEESGVRESLNIIDDIRENQEEIRKARLRREAKEATETETETK